MSQYIVFSIPDTAWDGIDYLYQLIELKPNYLYFAIIKAKNMETARRKYFDDYLYPNFLYNSCECIAQERLIHIFEDYDENELIKHYGDIDGRIIWNIISEDENEVSPKIAMQTVLKLSEQTIKELCFEKYEMTIAVSVAEYIG